MHQPGCLEVHTNRCLVVISLSEAVQETQGGGSPELG